jgi:transposase
MQAHPHLQMFQHDNARPHTAQVCTAALQTAGIPVMDWPAKSPNLSPIENLWAILGNHIRDMQNPTTTVAGLIAALQQGWLNIPPAQIRNLFNSMRRRCTKCINAHGGHICY